MKVLHIINNLGSGGAEKLLAELIPLMNQIKNIKADILLLTDKNNVFEESLLQKGTKVLVIKYRNMYDPRNIFKIKKHICEGEYDIVHSHLFPTQYWAALSKLILRNNKVKFITTEHSTHNRRREKYYFRSIDMFIYSKYDAIISITEKTKDNLINWIDPNRKKVEKHVVIENGVDIEKIKQAPPYSKNDLVDSIDDHTKLVCMVGRFSEAKDQPTLIKAISELSDDVHLILVGEGPLMKYSKDLVNQLGLSNRVHFLGFRQDVYKILKTVDIVVLSSHWEGFGLAAVEGMAAGKPVIASNIDGLADIVEHAGILFQARNDKELRAEISRLLTSHTYYEKIAKSCSERAEKYNVFNVLRSIEDTYIKMLTKWRIS